MENQTILPQNGLYKFFIGRLNRIQFLIRMIIIFLCGAASFFLVTIPNAGLVYHITSMQQVVNGSTHTVSQTTVNTFSIIIAVIFIITFIITSFFALSCEARRLHDFGITGWLSVLNFFAPFNFFLILFLLFYPGTRGENPYGKQPI